MLRSWLTDECGGGWSLVASPVFKTGVTRPGRAGWVRFPHSPAIRRFAAFALICMGSHTFFSAVAGAQRVDSARVKLGGEIGCVPIPKDSLEGVGPRVIIAGPSGRKGPLCKIPISPRRAFITSLLVPGLGQSRLGRSKAAKMFGAIELGAIAMSLKSLNDLSNAKDARRDTVSVPRIDSVTRNPVLDPVSGLPVFMGVPRNPNLADRVRARRTHLEDWLAAIAFNHLFAGADAFVAANLADFDANVNATSAGIDVRVMARVSW